MVFRRGEPDQGVQLRMQAGEPHPTLPPSSSNLHVSCPDQDSDSDSDLSLDEERSLSIPSSESEENVRLRGRFQRQFKRAAHSERLLTNPSNTTPKGKYHRRVLPDAGALTVNQGLELCRPEGGREGSPPTGHF